MLLGDWMIVRKMVGECKDFHFSKNLEGIEKSKSTEKMSISYFFWTTFSVKWITLWKWIFSALQMAYSSSFHQSQANFCIWNSEITIWLSNEGPYERVTEANGSGLAQGKGGDRQSCPGLSGSAWACPPISSIWVEKIEWGVRIRERRRRIARTRTSTRSRTRTRTRRRRWTAAYLAKLIRSMPRLSCLSPLHCALHFSTPALNFQSTFTLSKAFKGK